MLGIWKSIHIAIFHLSSMHFVRGRREIGEHSNYLGLNHGNITMQDLAGFSISSNGSFVESSSQGKDFYFAILSDPQIGLLHAFNSSWTANTDAEIKAMLQEEADIFKKITASLARPHILADLAFVAVLGNMQQYFPNDSDNMEWLRANGKKLSMWQRGIVKSAMTPFKNKAYLPGNHDVGHVIGEAALKEYRENWGPDFYSFLVEDINFIALNSQVYYEHEDTQFMRDHKDKQNAFFADQLLNANGKNVVLTHIPPFIVPGEKPGWSNWHDRSLFREYASDANFPQQWFCGHLHKNAENTVPISSFHGVDEDVEGQVEIVVSSSSGSTIDWGSTLDFFYPEDASKITTIPRSEISEYADKNLWNPIDGKKIEPGEARSGLRIVKCNAAWLKKENEHEPWQPMCYHKWFTYSRFMTVASLKHLTFR